MVKEAQVFIESMAFKGFGVAKVDGKVLFIPYSATGDKGRAEIIEEKKDYSFGRLREILEPSPWRVDPPCPYFGVCGGCQWQHIDPSIHGELKKEILRETLKRLGKLKEIPPITGLPAAEPYGYRVRVQLKVTGERIGYYKERSHQIVDIDHCPISHPLVNQMIRLIRKAPSPFFTGLNGIEINVSPEEGKGTLVLYPYSYRRGMEDLMREFQQTHPLLKALVVARKEGPTFFGDPHLHYTVPLNRYGEERSLRFRTSPESFFQVNLEQNRRLIETVLEFCDPKRSEKGLDLYSGIGNLTLPLAIEVKEILGIEANRTAIEDARFNAEGNGIKRCALIQGRVEDVLTSWTKETPDFIILDPPRQGCRQVLDQIAGLKPKKIVYVSCEPTTFARDLHSLSERGYHLQKLNLIDMFPQTYHMEVIGLLQS